MRLHSSYFLFATIMLLQLLGGCSNNSGPTTQPTTAQAESDSVAVHEASREYQVHYNSPVDLDSTDFYYQPISVVRQDANIRGRSFSSDSYETQGSSGIEGTCFNILFLQKSTLSERALLPHGKFVITSINGDKKPDARWPFLFYTIIKADTNADGKQNEEDANALFVSDRSGQHLRQLTPDGTQLQGKSIISKANLLLVEVRPDMNHDHEFTHADGAYWLRFDLTKLAQAPTQQPSLSLTRSLQKQMLERQSHLTE